MGDLETAMVRFPADSTANICGSRTPLMANLSDWPSDRKLKICVVGAGNLGHVLCGLWGARSDVEVNMLSRKAATIQSCVDLGIRVQANPSRSAGDLTATGTTQALVVGKVSICSADAAEVVPGCDLIILTVPSHARPAVLNQIVPYMSADKQVFLGAMPGLGGFDWMVDEALRARQLRNVCCWALKDVPYMCTRVVPGEQVDNLGPKKSVYLAVAPYHQEAHLAASLALVLQSLLGIPVEVMDHFLGITLTPGNPIIHPCIMYGMFGPHSQWDGKPLKEPPLFYEHVSELAAYFLQRVDTEVQHIKRALEQHGNVDLTAVWPLRVNLKTVYGTDVRSNRTLMLAMRTNKAYATIRTPMKQVPTGFIPNIEHRFFDEDIPYGLVILRGLAQIVDVKTPYMDDVLRWAQDTMGRRYLTENGLDGPDIVNASPPQRYGINTVHHLVHGSHTAASKL